MKPTTPRIVAFGEEAYVIESPAPASLSSQQDYHRLRADLLQRDWVRQVVSGFNNLTVFFDAAQISAVQVQQQLSQLVASMAKLAATADELQTSRLHRIPVRYSLDTGADLAELADTAGLSVAQVIELHTSQIYTVYCLGFLPGFAYLGDLPQALHKARRAEPRLQVPAGSVAIGGSQTGIYPSASPGGWHLIGRTELCLFNAQNQPPCLFRAGDRVEFYAI